MRKLQKIVEWTKVKIRIHSSNKKIVYFKEGEIWWASLGANVGFEQDGKNHNFERPILILKKFNKDLLWALPLTSKDKKGKYYYQFVYKKRKYSILLSQIRTISSGRLLRKIRNLPKNQFDDIRREVIRMI